MTVIVDTNVLLSAAIRDRLPQRVIEEIASRDDCFWIVTPEIVRMHFFLPQPWPAKPIT